ncbi:MAG: HD domain-containing phosphohydrolase [Trueperaceae bacterium]
MPHVRSVATDNSSSVSADLGVLLLGEVFDRVADALLVLDPQNNVIAANRAAEALLGARKGALNGLELSRLIPVGAPLLALLLAPDRNGPLELEVNLVKPSGGNVTANISAFRLQDSRTVLLCRVASADADGGAVATRDERRAAAVLESSRDVFVVFDEHGRMSFASPSASSWGLDRNDVTEGDLWRSMHPRDRDAAMAALGPLRGGGNRPAAQSRTVTITCRFRYQGAWRWFELVATDMSDDSEVKGLVVQAREVNERVQNTQELRVNEAYFRTLFERSQEGVVLIGRNRRLVRMGGAAAKLLGLEPGAPAEAEELDQLHPNDREALAEALDMIEARAGASESVRFRHLGPDGKYVLLEGSLTNLLHDPNIRAFLLNFRESREKVEALDKIRNLNEELRRRLAHLQSLRRIDMAINNSVDMRLVLDIFMVQLVQDLDVDAVAVLLYEPALQVLRPFMGRGFEAELRQRAAQRLGEGPAGRAALEHRSVFVPALRSEGDWGVAVEPEQQSGYASYMAVPMVAKGQLQGVIELYSRRTLEANDEWLEFLETYADQGAIAIENSQLMRSLERTNQELQRAYDRTIEGWANALDLKDEETAGHSKRVTEMTVRLARHLGVPQAEVVHIQRGALLHDIGKMGIPDEILLKRGPLEDDEFEIMRQHPVYAYELLSPIEFLRPALHIPYSHHEKWDGSGYPQGLVREQIPLAARIFAVVDVFDALTSDRPYREAWPVERAREYILEGRGSHFDPAVVDAFFELMDGKPPALRD